VQTELLFSNLNSSALLEEFIITNQGIGFVESVSQRFELNVNETGINIPIIFQYLISNKFSLETGIEIKYIIQQKLKKEYLTGPFDPLNNELLSFDYKNTNVNLAFGINYKVSSKLEINSRYYHNLNKKSSIILNNFNLGIEYNL
jgi:ribosome-associated toxin RatA of RatAB toxin-antitoxin module